MQENFSFITEDEARNLLPPYPAAEDVYTTLSKTGAPILMYGMGNGADRILEQLEKRGIEVADFFASDGFVRGHSFHGRRVLSFSEAREKYGEFRIVLSFGTRLREVLDLLYGYAERFELYLPDLPVAGKTVFDKDFYNTNYTELLRAITALSDEESRRIFAAVIHYKLTGRITHLQLAYSTDASYDECLAYESIKESVDAGAYDGDTASAILKKANNLRQILAIEPDAKNFKRLCKRIEREGIGQRVRTVHAALWSDEAQGVLSRGENRNSSLCNQTYNAPEDTVQLLPLDRLVERYGLSPDYIKYDVEGAEKEALLGSTATIEKYAPILQISVYHRSEDLFELLFLARRLCPGARFLLRRRECLPAWEIDLFVLKASCN